MATRSSDVIPKMPKAAVIAILTSLLALASWFIFKKVVLYASYDPATYDNLWPRRFGLIPHIAGGGIAALVGIVQLWLGLNGRTGALHRSLGRVYVFAIAVASIGGFYLALTIDPKLFAYSAGLFFLACAWVVTTSMALLAIHYRSFEQHREWMIRSYIVTFAFVTFRLVGNLLVDWKIASPGESDNFMAFACWSVPLLLAEPLIQLRRIRRR